MRRILFSLVTMLAAAVLAPAPPAAARPPALRLAVAANFIRPMEILAERFEAQSGIAVSASFASTGTLYAQITKGAPYDIFLAADARRPELLHQAGLAEEPRTYARGRAVLWSSKADLAPLSGWQAVIALDSVQRVGIAKPETAPYGEAAAAALRRAGLWRQTAPRLVYAQSVAQAFQFGEQGGVDATFTALSYALSDQGKKGHFWSIPEAPPVIQKGCILTRTANREAAEAFWRFLDSDDARAVTAAFGYE